TEGPRWAVALLTRGASLRVGQRRAVGRLTGEVVGAEVRQAEGSFSAIADGHASSVDAGATLGNHAVGETSPGAIADRVAGLASGAVVGEEVGAVTFDAGTVDADGAHRAGRGVRAGNGADAATHRVVDTDKAGVLGDRRIAGTASCGTHRAHVLAHTRGHVAGLTVQLTLGLGATLCHVPIRGHVNHVR